VTRLAASHDGHIVKPEGDGFWIVFPIVTAAALAAMRMQEELRLAQPGKGDDRLLGASSSPWATCCTKKALSWVMR